MSFARFQVTKSTNIIYEGPQAKLSTVNIENPTNYLKLLYNNDGVLDYLDYSPLQDIVMCATFGDFPVSGETNKLYYEQEFKKFYRFVDGTYYEQKYDVYSKSESDGKYRLISDSYTKSQTDSKYVIRLAAINDMTGSEMNNLSKLTVSGALTVDNTGITVSKPMALGWNDIDFVSEINAKIKLDGVGIQMLDNVAMGTHNITGVGAITSTTSTATTANATTANIGTLQNSGTSVTLGDNVLGNSKTITALSNIGSTAGTIGTLTATTSNLGTLGSNITGNAKTITGLLSLGATTVNAGSLANSGTNITLGDNILGNTKTITGLSNIGSTAGTITTLNATTSNLGTLGSNLACGGFNLSGVGTLTATTSNLGTLGTNVTGNAKTITGLGDITSTTGTITTLNATTSNLGTLGSDIAGGGNDITGLGNVTSTTGTITTLGSTTATIPTLKATTIQNSSGSNVATISAQNYLDIYGTSTSTGGIRFGAGKTPRETNEGKIFYNAAQGNLMIIGCNNDGTYTTDNNIRLADNVTIDNTLSAGNTSLGTLACGNTTVTGTCSVSGTTTLGTANITTAAVSGTATCGNVTCTANAVIGGNLNTIDILNYCVSYSQDYTAAGGYQTLTCSVPAGKNYRIVSALWRNVTTTYVQPEQNVDSTEVARCTDTQAFLYAGHVAGNVIRCTLVMDRNG
jgi:hypothetical protein